MCFSYIHDYLNRARYLLTNEGITSLFKKVFSSYIFCNRELYIHQHFASELDESDFLPDLKEYTFKLFTSNEMADDWARKTGIDFRKQILHGRQRLDAGAVAFCIFMHGQLVCIDWVALTQEAKNIINPLPFKVKFSEGQACSSGAETVPRYRGKGLLIYNWFQRNNYMRQKGLTVLIGTVVADNIPVLKAHTKFSTNLYARAHHIRFLWWQYWKETPLPEGFKPPIVKQ